MPYLRPKHVAHLELLTEQEDQAELASLILEMASVLPGKRNRWPTNAESRPGGLHELAIAAAVVPFETCCLERENDLADQ